MSLQRCSDGTNVDEMRYERMDDTSVVTLIKCWNRVF